MALFGSKGRKPLFNKRKEEVSKKPPRHELVDIPINSIIELSDIITYEETGDTAHAFKLVTRKKYEGSSLRRYMYHMRDAEEEEVVIGVDHIPRTKDKYEISRWIVDDECELGDPLPDYMTLYFPDPDNQNADIAVEYNRQEIVTATLSVTEAETEEKFNVELHEYISGEDEFMSIELCGNWLTFYVGVLITRSNIEIYPAIEAVPGRD